MADVKRADIQWVKIAVDIFEDEKILLIESMPNGYEILTVWFKILCLAGKQNNGGVFVKGKIVYTEPMLATVLKMKPSIVAKAISIFEDYGMVEKVNGVITIPNWEKHQNIDGMEKVKEDGRKRVAKYRERQKAIISASNNTDVTSSNVTSNVTSNTDVTPSNATEKEEEKEEDIIIVEEEEDARESDEKKTVSPPLALPNFESVKDLYNTLCVSFPHCSSLSESRKKEIETRFASGYTLEHFQMLFEKAEASSYLKGKNSRKWQATFDWLIKDANMAKVIDGNYDDRKDGSDNGSSSDDPWQEQRFGTYL